MVTREQIRAARVVRGWTVRDLAGATERRFPGSGVSYPTISAYENGADSRVETVRRLQVVLEAEGFTFINSGKPGIQWDAAAAERWAAEDAKRKDAREDEG